MLQRPAAIDRVFHALADRTRRELIQQLSQGPAAVSDLARPLPISLAAVVQHLQVLEDCGLVTTRKEGRVRTCQLDPDGLLIAEQWISGRRALWEGRLDRLGALLEDLDTSAATTGGPPAPASASTTARAPVRKSARKAARKATSKTTSKTTNKTAAATISSRRPRERKP